MKTSCIAVIAQGAMGAAIGARLHAHGVDVLTSLQDRSARSAQRAAAAGMRAVSDAELSAADILLSIVPPSEAQALAERLAPSLAAGEHKPVYIDCNAVSATSVQRIGDIVRASGCAFADAGIIGGPPRDGGYTPSLYLAGAPATATEALARGGLKLRVLDGPIGAASALKMSYAAITKGLIAVSSAALLSASEHGAADALLAELAESQAALLPVLSRGIPDMFPKAYRFVGEMEQIAGHFARPASAAMYRGIADLYRELAEDQAQGGTADIATLRRCFARDGAG